VCVCREQANFNMHACIHTTIAMFVYSKKTVVLRTKMGAKKNVICLYYL